MNPDCTTLSTGGHRYCAIAGCDCFCHLPPDEPIGDHGQRRRRRPHSYPRLDWQRRQAAGTAERRKRLDELTRQTW
jgi:hypothetical protein